MALGILNEQEDSRVTETNRVNNLFIVAKDSVSCKDNDLFRYTIGGTITTS